MSKDLCKRHINVKLDLNKIRNISLLTGSLVFSLFLFLAVATSLPAFYFVALFWIVCVTVLLWLGNNYIARWLNRYYPWSEHSSRRFFVHLFLSSVYSLACVNLTYYAFKLHLLGLAPDLEQMLVLNVYGLLLIIPTGSLHFGIYFMRRWKESFLYSQKLEHENLRSQYESLKSHLDPHFLFNSLNILSSLIDRNREEAQVFLEHFTDVYRYVLRTKNTELVSLHTELEFISSYLFMLEKRFDRQLLVEIQVPEHHRQGRYLPPLSLQLLVENAVKHNKASENQPLLIQIYVEPDGFLTVRNNLQAKEPEGYSARSGLQNISRRYRYVSEKALEVLENGTHFTVRLPLLALNKT